MAPGRIGISAAVVAAALAAAGTLAAAVVQPAFTQAEYLELVRRYARGERADAVAGLGAWSERDLTRQIAALEEVARVLERCPGCPSGLEGLSLKAAVMLHWDRDRAQQPAPVGIEQPRRCPGAQAELAGRLANVVARRPATADFASRFFRMVLVSCQWEACFASAERWGGQATLIFPRDAELLLARGSVREADATLATLPQLSVENPSATATANAYALAARARKRGLEQARRDFEAALAIDPAAGLARMRLGRVLWRLGEPVLARRQLEAARASLSQVDHVYLAHLFLGRVHQDAGRLQGALSEYRLATALHPSAQSAGVALSNALMLAGDAEGAALALRQGLPSAGRRSERDPYWDYLGVNAADLTALRDALYRESLK